MPQLMGKEIGPIGYGLMGLTWRPEPQSDEESFEAMKASLEAGCNFWNAGELYGTTERNSLHLLNKYFTKYPEDADKVVLSIKGCLNLAKFCPDGSPEGVKKSVETCLRVLDGKKKIDIFEPARVDPKVPIETTLKALVPFVDSGDIGGISLSEVSAATIHRAVKVTKIVGCEVELSLWSLDILSNGVAAACAEHNIPVVAYSPIGSGMLTGQIRSLDDVPENDMRRGLPRFQPENFGKNLELVHKLEEFARERGCTAPQLAISWARQLSKRDGNPEIIPIPGATKVDRVVENAKMVDLTSSELSAINDILKSFEVAGARYSAHIAAWAEG
ncbi:NADP-dependent oxidoreductase domain-containing protein [Amylocarpus encephaloides]|uniref:NADP-dependent oxidoreductase domain-containing protein n=1 Tax=Amylocarpus encephaloides TaxID=45428 RepID=A0A9P7YFQ9_9HELO|nr:NADP-dependent oxidoreductase domain-containing protein [Amylocarpus encephaloides]